MQDTEKEAGIMTQNDKNIVRELAKQYMALVCTENLIIRAQTVSDVLDKYYDQR